MNGKISVRERLECLALEWRHPFSGAKAARRIERAALSNSVTAHVGTLTIVDPKDWMNRFRAMLRAYPSLAEVAEAFFADHMDFVKKSEESITGPICVVVEKNDLERLKTGVGHHRKIGVSRFVVVDNASDDETLEWLSCQPDVDVVTVKVPYTTNRREAWVNRVIAHYGADRWYLVVDSDEMLVYPGCEKREIGDLVEECESEGTVRLRALMVDMYSKPGYFESGDRSRFLAECVYFDSDTYRRCPRRHLDLVCGGPRERVFGQAPWLTKYPLFKPGAKGIECKSHFLFPLAENKGIRCDLFLKHYKFIPGDDKEYERRAKSGAYYNGSLQYRKYVSVIEQETILDFFYPGTTRYVDSRSFGHLSEL